MVSKSEQENQEYRRAPQYYQFILGRYTRLHAAIYDTQSMEQLPEELMREHEAIEDEVFDELADMFLHLQTHPEDTALRAEYQDISRQVALITDGSIMAPDEEPYFYPELLHEACARLCATVEIVPLLTMDITKCQERFQRLMEHIPGTSRYVPGALQLLCDELVSALLILAGREESFTPAVRDNILFLVEQTAAQVATYKTTDGSGVDQIEKSIQAIRSAVQNPRIIRDLLDGQEEDVR